MFLDATRIDKENRTVVLDFLRVVLTYRADPWIQSGIENDES
jgi:hypothetical protein